MKLVNEEENSLQTSGTSFLIAKTTRFNAAKGFSAKAVNRDHTTCHNELRSKQFRIQRQRKATAQKTQWISKITLSSCSDFPHPSSNSVSTEGRQILQLERMTEDRLSFKWDPDITKPNSNTIPLAAARTGWAPSDCRPKTCTPSTLQW